MLKMITILSLSLILSVAATAEAQTAPAPFGTWVGRAAILNVFANGICAYTMPSTRVQGRCGWNNATSRGGVLTIQYVTPTVTQTFKNQIYFPITWVNSNTITIWGEVFSRR
jgi:hypothetical protein